MTVNHRRRILGTTRGHPGRWNDKTILLFESFLHGLKRGDGDLSTSTFQLFERAGANDSGVVAKSMILNVLRFNFFHVNLISTKIDQHNDRN
jgi:hypothetical protein